MIEKSRNEVKLFSALAVAGGGLLVLLGLNTRGGGSPRRDVYGPLNPGPTALGDPTIPGFAVGQVPLQIGLWLSVTGMQVPYSGPALPSFSHLRVVQVQGGEWVTVYASGVAGATLGPAASVTNFDLVSPAQPQPEGCAPQSLCMYPFPGTEVGPICGAAPQLGVATVLLEIYQSAAQSGNAADADGFSSPSCNLRIPVRRTAYRDKLLFT